MPRFAPRDFFATDAETLARALIGQTLIRALPGGTTLSGRIVETEAYIGIHDRASHAYNNRRTPRNESMYADAATLYVYISYGMHHCANIVCAARNDPQAVLLRALEPIEGLDTMGAHRGVVRRAREAPIEQASPLPASAIPAHRLCAGPGNLCRAMAIDRDMNGLSLRTGPRIPPSSRGWIGIAISDPISDQDPIKSVQIATGPRIGLGNAGAWADAPLRFVLRDSKAVSATRIR